jgi:hypothetical protein
MATTMATTTMVVHHHPGLIRDRRQHGHRQYHIRIASTWM